MSIVLLDKDHVRPQPGQDPVPLLDHEPLDEPLVRVRDFHGQGPDVQLLPRDRSQHCHLGTLHVQAEVVHPGVAHSQKERVERHALDPVQLAALLLGHGGAEAQEVVTWNAVGACGEKRIIIKILTDPLIMIEPQDLEIDKWYVAKEHNTTDF